MSKQDKIEAAQKAKAANPTKSKAKEILAAPLNNLELPAVAAGERFWQIAGTENYARKKETLKPLRTVLNLKAGINERELITTKEGKGDTLEEAGRIAAVPSNEWKFRITKGPDHPNA